MNNEAAGSDEALVDKVFPPDPDFSKREAEQELEYILDPDFKGDFLSNFDEWESFQRAIIFWEIHGGQGLVDPLTGEEFDGERIKSLVYEDEAST